MDIWRIENAEGKYLKIDICPVEAVHMYADMKALVTFIGTQYPHGKWDALGDAYFELRRRTNVKLRASVWLYRGKRKTSKNEIRAFVSAKNTHDPKTAQMRIPYKSYYIMESIVDCVSEIVARRCKIPDNLRPLCGELYSIAFMKRQIELYETEWRRKEKEWERLDFIAWYLHDDFGAEASPFNKRFAE